MAGLLGSFFNFVDPILDTIDPIHNPVQTWTTGSSSTKGQSPYFETIAPMVLDLFLPGVGSAVGAADKASTGNYLGAGLSALSAYGALGSAGSAAADTGAGLTATEGLSSVAPAYESAGAAAGSGFSGADSFGTLSANSGNGLGGYGVGALNAGADSATGVGVTLGGNTTGLGSSELGTMAGNASSNYGTLAQTDYARAVPVEGGNGWQYFDNGTAISPDGKYYLGGEQITASGGQQMGLLDTAGKYYDKAKVFANGIDGKQVGKTVGAGLMTGQQQQAKNAQRMPTQLAPADFGGQSSGPAQSFQTLSPYSSFSGGFNPQKRRGLL